MEWWSGPGDILSPLSGRVMNPTSGPTGAGTPHVRRAKARQVVLEMRQSISSKLLSHDAPPAWPN